MDIDDRGIILSIRKFGENSAIITLLTSSHGIYAGFDRQVTSKAKRGIYQIGNIVEMNWKARLDEQLGSLRCELLDPIAAKVMCERKKLAALNCAANLTQRMLGERDNQPQIYNQFINFIENLCAEGDWLADYVKLEFTLLAAAGFGLDLERCAATGQSNDLLYVSPKSGRAVSREAGREYHDKLFVLPEFLKNIPHPTPLPKGEGIEMREIIQGLKICGYFIEQRIFAPQGRLLPSARVRFVESLAI